MLLVIFGHEYINADYVFGTCTTLAGALFGYHFGIGASPTAEVQAEKIIKQEEQK